MPPIFKTLADADIASFCAGTHEPALLRRQLDSALHVGSTRRKWCWMALAQTGSTLARHYWWGRPGAPHPMGVELVSAEDRAVAVSLLCHARDRFDAADAWCCITAPVEEGGDPSIARTDLVSVLGACGFGFEVSRVSVEWSAGAETAPPSERLVFRPARGFGDDALVALFSAVTDGSLDHGMISDRAELGAEGEARQRLERARSYRAEPDWFQVACTPAGKPVGYVVPGYVNDAHMIGEIGVAANHRGIGYVDDLLGWATRLLASCGAQRIVADTDRVNTPMRAAFGRAGYRELRWRDDYRWQRDEPRDGRLRIPADTTIRTARLELSPLRIDDAAEMAVLLDDDRLHKFIGGRPATPDQLRDRYRRLVAGSTETGQIWLNWIVRDKRSGAPVGTMQATIVTAAGPSTAEVAWIVGTAWQGRGFAKEAARSVVEWLQRLGVGDVIAHVNPSHRASAAVARHAGFRPTPDRHDGETLWRLARP